MFELRAKLAAQNHLALECRLSASCRDQDYQDASTWSKPAAVVRAVRIAVDKRVDYNLLDIADDVSSAA